VLPVKQVAQSNAQFYKQMIASLLDVRLPTQTAQETVDSLEMVRQLFE
jgi:hypothetical protein